jgi:hypothetical protein
MAIHAGSDQEFQPCRVITGRAGSGPSSPYSFCGVFGSIREFPDGTSTAAIPICERHGESLDDGAIYAVMAVGPDLAAIELT